MILTKFIVFCALAMESYALLIKPSIELTLKREKMRKKTAEELVKLALENRSIDNALLPIQ